MSNSYTITRHSLAMVFVALVISLSNSSAFGQGSDGFTSPPNPPSLGLPAFVPPIGELVPTTAPILGPNGVPMVYPLNQQGPQTGGVTICLDQSRVGVGIWGEYVCVNDCGIEQRYMLDMNFKIFKHSDVLLGATSTSGPYPFPTAIFDPLIDDVPCDEILIQMSATDITAGTTNPIPFISPETTLLGKYQDTFTFVESNVQVYRFLVHGRVRFENNITGSPCPKPSMCKVFDNDPSRLNFEHAPFLGYMDVYARPNPSPLPQPLCPQLLNSGFGNNAALSFAFTHHVPAIVHADSGPLNGLAISTNTTNPVEQEVIGVDNRSRRYHIVGPTHRQFFGAFNRIFDFSPNAVPPSPSKLSTTDQPGTYRSTISRSNPFCIPENATNFSVRDVFVDCFPIGLPSGIPKPSYHRAVDLVAGPNNVFWADPISGVGSQSFSTVPTPILPTGYLSEFVGKWRDGPIADVPLELRGVSAFNDVAIIDYRDFRSALIGYGGSPTQIQLCHGATTIWTDIEGNGNAPTLADAPLDLSGTSVFGAEVIMGFNNSILNHTIAPLQMEPPISASSVADIGWVSFPIDYFLTAAKTFYLPATSATHVWSTAW